MAIIMHGCCEDFTLVVFRPVVGITYTHHIIYKLCLDLYTETINIIHINTRTQSLGGFKRG